MIMHRSEFLRELKKTFPELREDINAQEGLIHLEMNVFHKFAQDAIDENNLELLNQIFFLADKFYRNGNSKLKNAIDVSFVEGLKFKNRKAAWKIMPETLKKLYISFHRL